MEYDSIFLKHSKRALMLLGLWPASFSNYWKNILYKIHFVILQGNYSFFVGSLIIGMKYTIDQGPFVQADVIQNNLLYALLLWKMMLLRTGPIRKLIKDISRNERHIISLQDDILLDMYMKNVYYNYKMLFAVTGIIVFGLCQFIPLVVVRALNIRNNPENKLDLPEWFPYSGDRYFLASFYYQSFNRIYAAVILIGTDPLLFSLVYFPLTRLRLLGRKLSFFQDYCDKDKSKRPENVLRSLILEHKDIIRYIHDLNHCMKWFYFMDFLVRSYHISLVLFKIMALQQSKDKSFEEALSFAFTFTYLSVLILQMHIVYYHANELRLESMEISSYIFQSNWYDQSSACKKSFLIMMMRSMKPFEIKIGDLNTMTADIIVKVFKAGYTYILLSKQ